LFQLQLQFNKKGDWENTVYQPVEYDKAMYLLKEYKKAWQHVHNYRLVSV